jgi:hypothetical protein
VLLRKKITSHWPKLPPHAKASLKQALIDSITIDHRSFSNHFSQPLPPASSPLPGIGNFFFNPVGLDET